MTDNNILNVWYETKLVGQLRRDEIGKIGFRYNDDWLINGFPISQQLPLSVEDYDPADNKAHKFFANLLPEANARSHIVRNFKIANSDFELLKAIGGECAGALSILPIGHDYVAKVHYKKLSEEDLLKIVIRKGNIASFFNEKNRPRLSLAGAQDKCPVLYDDTSYFLPQDAAPSSHIIKFELNDYRNIPAYEYFLTQLANAIQLPTIKCELKQIKDHYFLLIKRYDRIVISHNNIQRLHQEDFCQALGFGHEYKYQQQGGPSFYDCYNLIQKVSANPIIDAENLIKWQIFNCLVGNSDGHAKNLSLIYENQAGIRLAPFYDLVCTRAVDGINNSLALSIGNEFDPNIIVANIIHWENLSKQCSIRFKYLLDIIFEIAEKLLINLEPVQEQFEKENGAYPALQRVEKIVTKQCKKVLKLKQ